MLTTGGGLLAVFLLIVINGFFVAAEFALVTVRRTRVEQLLAEGRPGARNLDDATGHLDSYIAAAQLGITLASLGLGFIGEPALAGLLEPVFGALGGHVVGVIAAFVVITVLLVVAGELAPKGIALQYGERSALIVAGPLRAFRALFRPVIWLLNEGGWAIASLVGVSRDIEGSGAPIGAEELRLVVRSSVETGAIAEDQQFLLERVLRFGSLTAEDAMVPRTEVIAIRARSTAAEARAIVREHHFSRYPVYDGDLDHVVGVVHARDLLSAGDEATIDALARQPFHVPAQTSVHDLLTQMRRRRTHFAIAVDEYGGTDGIVTLENVLEEIVGELQDEFEEPETAPERRPGGVIRIDGLESVDVLKDFLAIEVEPGPYNTVAGFVLDCFGHIPRIGEDVELAGHRFRVVEMDDLRIAAVEVAPVTPPPSATVAPPDAGQESGQDGGPDVAGPVESGTRS